MTPAAGPEGSGDEFPPAGADAERSADASATFAITGMGCASCSAVIERALADAPGVSAAAVDLVAATLRVRYDPAVISDDGIIAVVRDAGFDGEWIPEGGVSDA